MMPCIKVNRKRPAPRWASAVLGSLALAGAGIAATPASLAAPPAKPVLYRVFNLGPGDVGIALNNKGQAALTHADPWDPPGGAWFYDGVRLHDIPAPAGGYISTTGVNDHGQVTGGMSGLDRRSHSFVWTPQRGMVDIGTLPGYTAATGPAINNRGEIAATADAGWDGPPQHAMVWSPHCGAQDLGTLVPGPTGSATALAINDSGMVVGNSWAGGHTYQAFAWTRNGGMINIDTINSRYSNPVAVGAKGQVAGNLLNDPNNYGSAFFWTAATGMRDLGPGSGTGSGVFGMSSGGRIAGIVSTSGAFEKAMTWTQEDGMVELGTLGGHRSAAFAANNKGQVVGASVTNQDRYHAFVWSAAEGMADLNQRLYRAPPGLELYSAVAIGDDGSIAVASNTGLLLLKPGNGPAAPFIPGPITAPDSAAVGAPLEASISFLTDDRAGYTVTWSWGDGTSDPPVPVTINNGTGTSTARHTYSSANEFLTLSAKIADAKGKTVRVTHFVYTYDNSWMGAIGGIGSMAAPARPNLNWPGAGGIASFGFTAPPEAQAGAAAKGAGKAGRLFFNLGGRQFRSTDAHLVSLQGQRTELAGTGTINGTGGYRFTLSTTAGVDKGTVGSFELQISHTDPKTAAEVVDFDSRSSSRAGPGAPRVAGRILVQ